MTPAIYIVLEALPLTPNQKVDRKALPAPDGAQRSDTVEYVAPRNATEQALAQIWSEVLSAPKVGVHDNFFELGGHSLLAARLRALIQTQFGVGLALPQLFGAPTIAELAKVLEGLPTDAADLLRGEQMMQEMLSAATGEATEGGRSLVALETVGAGPPLFCIHGLGGGVAPFLSLAGQLTPRRPIYGLQAQGLQEGQRPHESIEEMAAHYLREIRGVQPAGPYFLAGWSMGGLIAMETARQLTADGQTVGLLALFDTHLPSGGGDYQPPDDEALFAYVAPLLGVPESDLKQRRGEDPWAFLAEKANLPPGVGAATIRRLAEVSKAQLAAMAHYKPSRLEQQAILFRAKRSRRVAARTWNRVCPRVVIETVPGDHYSMLREPHVAALAERLSACLGNGDARS